MSGDFPERLDSLIEGMRSFALYRSPHDRYAHLLLQEKTLPKRLYDLRNLNTLSGFVMAPFRVSASCPVVLLEPDGRERILLPCAEAPTPPEPLPPPPAMDEAYRGRFLVFLSALGQERFHKLVLSRRRLVVRGKGFSPSRVFLRACLQFPDSYVYLFHTPYTGSWLGSTPELLLEGQNNRWHTVALAGTQTLSPGVAPAAWDDKNRTEQRLVAQYIHTQLARLGIQAEAHGPYTVQVGRLAHLQSDFRFTLPGLARPGDLLHLLHPTPAVSGLPKEEACCFISAHEGYRRRYYSGFTGWIDPEGPSEVYVNLRCMNILRRRLALYAGGGLLTTSLPEGEWQETENKMQTMLSLLKTEKA
ncbi:MAG: isochorismate synthase [Tannerellaceae bacterium]|nr:isochorismate synthase [Tannerellaceae bacterium]